jgi:hypothetical protein
VVLPEHYDATIPLRPVNRAEPGGSCRVITHIKALKTLSLKDCTTTGNGGKKAAGVFPRIHPEEKTPAPKNADIHMLRKALGITPNWFYIIVVCNEQTGLRRAQN